MFKPIPNSMKTINILLVEDNEGDILLTTEAFENTKVMNQLNVVRDGKEAIAFLNKEGNYSDVCEPDILLLDVNLPKKNGHEVLEYIKSDVRLKHIPVIMLSTSSSQADILKSYCHHANCYITKPVDADRLVNVIEQVQYFWISIAKLPSKISC